MHCTAVNGFIRSSNSTLKTCQDIAPADYNLQCATLNKDKCCSGIIVKILKPHMDELLREDMLIPYFSLYIDESTVVADTKYVLGS